MSVLVVSRDVVCVMLSVSVLVKSRGTVCVCVYHIKSFPHWCCHVFYQTGTAVYKYFSKWGCYKKYVVSRDYMRLLQKTPDVISFGACGVWLRSRVAMRRAAYVACGWCGSFGRCGSWDCDRVLLQILVLRGVVIMVPLESADREDSNGMLFVTCLHSKFTSWRTLDGVRLQWYG